MRVLNFRVLINVFTVSALLFACGSSRRDYGAVAASTAIEQAFLNAATENHIPVRLMMAVGFMESRLRDERSSASYQFDGRAVSLAPAKGESAFGASFADLGLSDNGQAGLSEQIAAYGRFVKSKVGSDALPANAVTAEEKMRWIWKLAGIHSGEGAKRNLMAIFSREIMETLNTGFSVQSADGVIAHLDKEPAPLKDEDFPENVRQDLMLDVYHSDIRSAYLFSLAKSGHGDVVNHPTRIEVIHCPFILSTCLQMQETASTDSTPFGAHYVIPGRSDSTVPGILQFLHHDETASLIGIDGKPEVVKDRIIIMLAGSSGRYLDGQRTFADPMWMTDFQLRLLGAAISEICSAISRSDGVDRAQCMTFGGTSGISFRTQAGDAYLWGDIPDFDETIIAPYLTGADGVSATTTLTLTPDTIQTAGTPFRLTVGFQSIARRLELERLVRCATPDHRVVWEPVDQQQVLSVTQYAFNDNVWYDAGPNGTGDQFFRVKATGDAGKFLGWSTRLVQSRGFDKTWVPVASKYCLRNGT